MTLYALGSMLGSGIYGLIGQAAGQVGNAVWLAFLVALVAALLTALSYASLGSRYPHAGGASYVVQRAYGSPMLSFVIGLTIACSALTSVATQARVFAANLAHLIGPSSLPLWALVLGFLLFITWLVLRGIRESMWVNVVCTCVEAAGLMVVVAVGFSFWGRVDYFEIPQTVGQAGGDMIVLLVLQGAVLTFFAFIGFEDSINVAEECRDPQRTIPIGLIAAMAISALLYMAVAITAVSVVPWRELADAPGPLTEVMARAAPSIPPAVFTVITLFAVGNTALVNYVTASRLIYGMAHQGLLPPILGAVHATRRTPHWSIAILFLVLAPLSLTASVGELASATVLLLLVVFSVVNFALLALKRRPSEPRGSFEVHGAVPLAGAVVCALLVCVRAATGNWKAPALAAAILLGILGCYILMRLSHVRLLRNVR